MTQPPSWPEQPSAGDAASGPPLPSPPDPSQPPPGQPALGQPALGQPAPGQPAPQHAPPSYGPPTPPGPAQPLYPGTSYGVPQAAPPGYGYGYPYQPAGRTNGMAVASMVVSIASAPGLCVYGFGGFLGIVGAILGHVARRQVKTRYEGGEGMALAGIIVGWIVTGLAVILSTLSVIFIIMAINDPAFQSEF